MELVRAKGLFSFYEDGHQECCRVRKVGSQRPDWLAGQHMLVGRQLSIELKVQ
jgi:hypothetical protein